MDAQETNKELDEPAEKMIWNTSSSPSSAKPAFRRKRKYHWGFFEVIGAFALLIAVQIGYGLIITTALIQEQLASGANLDDVDVITDQILQEITTNPKHLLFFTISMYVIWIGAMVFATYTAGIKNFFKEYWLRFNWKKDIPLGIIIAALLRGTEIAVLTLIQALGVDLSGSGNTDAIVGQEGIWFFVIAIGIASFLGPISEELFFRGMVLQAFLRKFRRGNISSPQSNFGATIQRTSPGLFNSYKSFRNWTYKQRYALSIIFSSILFGVMHWQGTNDLAGWLAPIETGLVGVLLAFIVIKTKRLGLAITIHVFFNLSGVILASMGV